MVSRRWSSGRGWLRVGGAAAKASANDCSTAVNLGGRMPGWFESVSSLPARVVAGLNASASRRPPCRRTSAVHPIPAAQIAKIAAPRRPVCCRDREFGGLSRATATAVLLSHPDDSRKTGNGSCTRIGKRKERQHQAATRGHTGMSSPGRLQRPAVFQRRCAVFWIAATDWVCAKTPHSWQGHDDLPEVPVRTHHVERLAKPLEWEGRGNRQRQ